jgi:hypothetical protein
MSTLLSLPFWFNLRPGSMSGLFRNLLLIGLLILVVAAIYLFLAKRKKGAYKNFYAALYNFCLSNFIIGGLLLFFNYEIVPFFSARFWYLLWLIALVWWLIVLIKKWQQLARKKEENAKIDEITKYLP